MSIGNKIYELRKKNNLSQEQLAEKLNVTRQTISKWELNETTPDINQAKEISKIFKISLDDLVDNDIQSMLLEKVSNTEKLAGLVIKILKGLGIFILCLIVDEGSLVQLALILFSVVKTEPGTVSSAELTCSIENNSYTITIGSDKYYSCPNCTKEMNVYLKDITDWANITHSVENINKYFIDNGGSCDL